MKISSVLTNYEWTKEPIRKLSHMVIDKTRIDKGHVGITWRRVA